MPASRDDIIKQLAKKNDNRWVGGQPTYDCLSCAHAHSTEQNTLMCVQNPTHHKAVADTHVCAKWN